MTMWQDVVNAGFELAAGTLLWLNNWKLHKDRKVQGISVVPVVTFTAWGYWNLYYYPHLEQWLSMLAGVLVVVANTCWVLQLAHYSRQARRRNNGQVH